MDVDVCVYHPASFARCAHLPVNQYSRQRWYTDEYHLTPENLRMPFKRVTFHPRGNDKIVLEGWHIPQTQRGRMSKRLVVLNNPHNSDKSNLLGLAQDLWDAGYSVFMYDFRSHARNNSVQQSVGYFEQQDALAALDTATEVHPDASIAVVGASMGGAVALMTAYTCPQVRAAFRCRKGTCVCAILAWWLAPLCCE